MPALVGRAGNRTREGTPPSPVEFMSSLNPSQKCARPPVCETRGDSAPTAARATYPNEPTWLDCFSTRSEASI